MFLAQDKIDVVNTVGKIFTVVNSALENFVRVDNIFASIEYDEDSKKVIELLNFAIVVIDYNKMTCKWNEFSKDAALVKVDIEIYTNKIGDKSGIDDLTHSNVKEAYAYIYNCVNSFVRVPIDEFKKQHMCFQE